MHPWVRVACNAFCVPRDSTALTFCCLLWARPGFESDMARYETAVIALLTGHRAELVQRVASNGADGHPHEVQLYRFPSRGALDGFLGDPRREAMSAERDRVVERTELFPVHAPTY